jgi:hypothetical protein
MGSGMSAAAAIDSNKGEALHISSIEVMFHALFLFLKKVDDMAISGAFDTLVHPTLFFPFRLTRDNLSYKIISI